MTPSALVGKILNAAGTMSRPAYRGQAIAGSWQLRSGAVDRLVKAHGDQILENEGELRSLLSEYHNELILQMEVIDGEKMPDLQRLSVLQHHGAATGLLDFTESPLVALWFACKDELEDEGRLFVLDIGDHVFAVNGRNLGEEDLFRREQVVYYEPDRSLSNRIVAQQSLFVICNPPTVQNPILDYVDISKEIKGPVLDYLAGLGLSESTLFVDVPGLASANSRFKSLEPMRKRTPEHTRGAGLIAYRAGRLKNALEHFNAYADARPNYAQPYCLIGDTLAELRQFTEAIDAYSRAIESIEQPIVLESGSLASSEILGELMLHTLYYNRGNARAAIGLHVEAVSDFSNALNHGNMLFRNVVYNRGNSKYALENFDSAFVDFEKAWSDRVGSEAALAMGNCKLLGGHFEEALPLYLAGVNARSPENAATICRQNANQLQALLGCLQSGNYSTRRDREVVYVEAVGELATFPFKGNQGNAGNTSTAMANLPGGTGYKGILGFAVVKMPKSL